MGPPKEGFLAFLSPVILISRTLTQDKRCVSNFRYINARIAKTNLVFPFVRYTFFSLGCSKCEVLSVVDLKDVFHSLRLAEGSKKYCWILLYFGSASFLYQRMKMKLHILPAIWQSYINAILDCLQSR